MTDTERDLLLALARYIAPAEPHESVPADSPHRVLLAAIRRLEQEINHPQEAR